MFKFFVNIHRLVILNDRSNYYSFLKFKIVFLYFFYLVSLLIIGAIISLVVQYILTFLLARIDNFISMESNISDISLEVEKSIIV